MNLSELLSDRASTCGNKVFLYFERQSGEDASSHIPYPAFSQTLTFGELDDRVNQACHYLASQGVTRGDVLNLHLPNCPAFLVLWFAAARIGAVMMPTNVLAAVDELDYLLRHSNSKIAFTTTEHLEKLQECENNIDALSQVIVCDPFTETPGDDAFESLIRDQPETDWHCPVDETDLAAIMYTSGTTSKPKGVMVTHANYITAGQTVADAIELTESDRHYIVLPLFHGNAQYYSTMSALLSGASIALMDRFSASQYFTKCIEYGCTVGSLFAAPMRMILAQPECDEHRNNALRIVIYAQNVTAQQMQDWHQRFNAPLCQLWGMTETMGPPLMNPLHGERRNWTVGKPTADYEIVLVDGSGAPVDIGEEGEITVKGTPGRSIMSGYFNDPEATRKTIIDNRIHTGDNAVQDEAGFYRFVDRKKDMIKRSGENVSAGEVENVVLQHPAVFECAVIGLPDALRDESIVAVVVLHQNARITPAQIIEFCAGKLAKFRVPQRVIIEQALPKTSVGKIQKHLIRNALLSSE